MEGREEDRKGPWNCDTDPTSSRLAVKIPGGERERDGNDKTSSVNIKSSLLADVCADNFIQPLQTPATLVCFFNMTFYFQCS